MKTKRKALSLFSGAGGMDIGVSKAGFEIIASIEVDPYCCDTLTANIIREKRKTKVIQKDIRTIDPHQLMRELGIRPKELDLVFGGPPCQAFSQIGKQEALNDERGLLLFEMMRFAEAFQPKALFIEQVKGLLSARDHNGIKGKVFEMFLKDLERKDYVPKWKVVNSAEYGVPQLRKRVFVVATKKPNGFSFPLPTNGPLETSFSLFPLKPFKTVGEALSGLRKPAKKGEAEQVLNHVDVTPEGDKTRIDHVPEGSFLAAQTHLSKKITKRLTKKDTTKFLRLSRKKPSNTLRCGEIFFHPLENRYLTPREYMRVHGYPDEYVLKGPIRGRSGRVEKLDQHRQVANSVPPPVAQAIAEEIERTISCQESLRHSVTA